MGLAVLCPGQGNQHSAMFDLLDADATATKALDEAREVLGWDVREAARGLPWERLFENRIAQPLICSAAIATWTAWAPGLPKPVAFVGYSVGELAAYGCSGAFDLRQTLLLAQRRAALMDSAGAGSSGLLALRGLHRAAIAALCKKHGAEIAIVNGPDHFVVGAETAALQKLQTAAVGQGARTACVLPVGVAAHTSLLGGIVEEFRADLEASNLTDPPIPVVAGIDGVPVRSRYSAIRTLCAQLHSPIEWVSSIQTAIELGAKVFIELGPGSSLSRMMRDIFPKVAVRSAEEFRSLQGARDWACKQLA